MSVFYFIAAYFLIKRLNKLLTTPEQYVRWRDLLNYASWGIWVLFAVIYAVFHGWEDDYNGFITDLAGCFLLLGLLIYVEKQEDFKAYKFLFQAHYPLVLVGFIDAVTEIVAPNFYEKHDSWFIFAIIAAFFWIYARWANSKKQRQELEMVSARNNQLDALVEQRTAELTSQKNQLEETVKLLKTTQAQLVQQEKLASLGELTAGIAHEIQNPLNFVNNFSEVSMELIDEMGEELAKGDMAEAMAIAGDVKQNLEKIIHHGKRADGIVKGMLQHSRTSSNVMEPTDINALADEYLRLAYHGLRAKDKTFNAEFIARLDPQLPKVNVISQDVGRVLLNLFTNAFYATQQKQKEGIANYKPVVEVSTKTGQGFIFIVVKDNGTGIPDDIKDKILQPFFTTKPTGEGTGLGLSLSYDIIVKGHGGSINIESVEHEYSSFIIKLPL